MPDFRLFASPGGAPMRQADVASLGPGCPGLLRVACGVRRSGAAGAGDGLHLGGHACPPVPTSYLDVPVRYDLAPAMHWLESEVPASFGTSTSGTSRRQEAAALRLCRRPRPVPARGERPDRDPAGGRAVPGAGLVQPAVLPEISGKCGDERSAASRAAHGRDHGAAHQRLDAPRRRPAPSSRPLSNPERDRCKVTFLRAST